MASILAGALILMPDEASPWVMTLSSAFIIWVGFIFPALTVNHRYGLKPWSLTWLDSGHWLGVLLLQAAVMQAVGVVGPDVLPTA